MLKKKSTYFIAGVILIGVVGAIALTHNQSSITNQETNPKQTSVKVLTAQTTHLDTSTRFNASLSAYEEGIVSSKTGGKIIQIMFENGQVVSKGDALAKLDTTDLKNNIATTEAQIAAANAQLTAVQTGLQKAQANFETSQRTYNRSKTLYESEIISTMDFENVETAFKVAQADLEAAKASVLAQKSSLDAASINLSVLKDALKETTITAPIDGIMDGKSISIGQYIGVGTPFGKVVKSSPILAVIQINESDLNYIKLGAPATFQSSESSQSFSGTVEQLGGTADPISRKFECKISIQNPDFTLKPGSFGTISISEDSTKQAITLPVQALGGTVDEYHVFVNQDGIAKKHAITIGKIFSDTVEIIDGVQDGDAVILTNVGTLQDGDAIKVAQE